MYNNKYIFQVIISNIYLNISNYITTTMIIKYNAQEPEILHLSIP